MPGYPQVPTESLFAKGSKKMKKEINTKKIRLIGLDLDGTVLTNDKHITERTRKALESASEQGVVVMTATGRPFNAIAEEFLNLKGVRYLMSSNGASVYDRDKEELIYHACLTEKQCLDIMSRFSRYHCWREICIGGISYVEQDMYNTPETYFREAPMIRYVLQSRVPVPDIIETIRSKKENLEKVCAFFYETEEREKARQEFLNMENIVQAEASMYNLEVSSPKATKGKALFYTGKLLGIEPSEVMACGDGMNDYEMVVGAGLGVAMGNAMEKLKEAADFITGTNEEDGVAYAVERFVLGQ